ncbi:MAG: YdcF family protein (plasmid) [Leptolyngbya sp. BL-A-14]
MNSRKARRWLIGMPLALLMAVFIAINLIPAFFITAPMYPVGNKTFDVIIALGYPSLENGQPSAMLKQRVGEAVRLFNAHAAHHLMLTGGAAHNRFVEAAVMAAVARSMGVPAAAIVQETQAKNTCQNALNSVGIMQKKHWQSAIVVTSPNHLKRANYLFAPYPIHVAVASSGYPAEMHFFVRLLFNQWEQYALTRLALFGYPHCR